MKATMNKQENTITRLYDKWNDLKTQAKEDCKNLNISNLEQDFDLVGHSIKWLNFFQDWKRVLITLEIKRKKIKRELTEYYRLEYNMRLETKDELLLFIETDDKYISILEQTQIVNSILIFCESVLDKLKMKSYEIKNWIDYQKFINGN